VAVVRPPLLVSCAETWSPTLIPLMLCTWPVTRVDGVTAAVTGGPAPLIVIAVTLTAVIRPVRKICATAPLGGVP
jgi:hypothetical protein